MNAIEFVTQVLAWSLVALFASAVGYEVWAKAEKLIRSTGEIAFNLCKVVGLAPFAMIGKRRGLTHRAMLRSGNLAGRKTVELVRTLFGVLASAIPRVARWLANATVWVGRKGKRKNVVITN